MNPMETAKRAISLVVGLAMVFWCNGLPVRKSPVPAYFPLISSENLQIWLPEVRDDEKLAAAGCPFVGLPLPPEANTDMAERLNADLNWNLHETDILIACIMDDGVRFVAQTELAGYQQGDSGGVYFESWLTGTSVNGLPEIIRKSRGFKAPDPDDEPTDADGNFYFERMTWNGWEYRSVLQSPNPGLKNKYRLAGFRYSPRR